MRAPAPGSSLPAIRAPRRRRRPARTAPGAARPARTRTVRLGRPAVRAQQDRREQRARGVDAERRGKMDRVTAASRTAARSPSLPTQRPCGVMSAARRRDLLTRLLRPAQGPGRRHLLVRASRAGHQLRRTDRQQRGPVRRDAIAAPRIVLSSEPAIETDVRSPSNRSRRQGLNGTRHSTSCGRIVTFDAAASRDAAPASAAQRLRSSPSSTRSRRSGQRPAGSPERWHS